MNEPQPSDPVPPTTAPRGPAAASVGTPQPTVLVLGARGRFGAAAVRAFAAAGWRVLAQGRAAPPPHPASVAAPPAGAEPLSAPLTEPDALAAQVRRLGGVRAVVYAVNPPYTRWAAEMLPLARHGMAVAETLDARFMLPGNVYAYGEGMPSRLDEDTPARPSTAKGRLRLQLEDELAERGRAGRLRSVVVRAGDFYGSGRGSWFDLVIAKDIARGRLVYPGPTDVPHAWAYLPDLARAFVALAAADGDAPAAAPAHRRLHFAGHVLTGDELLALIEAAAGDIGIAPARGWRRGRLPWPLLRLAGLVHPMSREVVQMAYLWRVPHALDGRRLAATIGAPPSTAPAAAVRAALIDLGFSRPSPWPSPVPRTRH